jgi:GNAT superfamily N-acetyltransferase
MARAVPPAGFGVRPAELQDAAAIHAVVIGALGGAASRARYASDVVDWLVAQATVEGVAAQIAQWDTWVATEPDGEICGTAGFDGTRVRKVFVHPERQGLGLGHVLLDAVEGAARRAGLSRLAVRSSLNAVGIYESRGFKPGETAAYGPAEMVMMEKSLAEA